MRSVDHQRRPISQNHIFGSERNVILVVQSNQEMLVIRRRFADDEAERALLSSEFEEDRFVSVQVRVMNPHSILAFGTTIAGPALVVIGIRITNRIPIDK